MPVAHLNWAYLRAPWGAPAVAGFCDNVERVNAAAESARGYIGRAMLGPRDVLRLAPLVRETGGAPFDAERLAATISVWDSAGALRDFVVKSVHGRFLSRRGEWFVPQGVPTYVLWPVQGDRMPTAGEAFLRMRRLTDDGPTTDAHDFNSLPKEAA